MLVKPRSGPRAPIMRAQANMERQPWQERGTEEEKREEQGQRETRRAAAYGRSRPERGPLTAQTHTKRDRSLHGWAGGKVDCWVEAAVQPTGTPVRGCVRESVACTQARVRAGAANKACLECAHLHACMQMKHPGKREGASGARQKHIGRMKINEDTVIYGCHVALLPYSAKHVRQ